MDSIVIGIDMTEILDNQSDLSRRISRLEESIGQRQNNESLRDYQAKVDQCVANVERLTHRFRTEKVPRVVRSGE